MFDHIWKQLLLTLISKGKYQRKPGHVHEKAESRLLTTKCDFFVESDLSRMKVNEKVNQYLYHQSVSIFQSKIGKKLNMNHTFKSLSKQLFSKWTLHIRILFSLRGTFLLFNVSIHNFRTSGSLGSL